MENTNDYKYDVFISYSRKDYVDENKNIIPGNIVSQIKTTLDENNIKYWIDEEGDLTGKKFAHIIAGKIRESLIFLFVCSKNSVASKWVDRELAVADEFDKHIIPFICDESYKDDKVVMYTAALDRIEFFGNFNPNIELEKLVNAISKDKKDLEEKRKKEAEELERIRQEEEKQKRLKEEAEKKEKTKKEIKQLSAEYGIRSLQQKITLQQLHEKNAFIGNKTKKCPICGKEQSIKASFCDECGFQFPALYSIDGNETYQFDEQQLKIAKTNYNTIAYLENEKAQITTEVDLYRDEARKLVSENEQLKETLEKISIECENHLKVIAKKEEEASLFREKNFSLSSQLKIQEKQSEEKLKQLEKQKETLESQSFCLQEEITRLKKQLNQSEKSKDQLQHDYNEALKRITELEKELDKPVADTPQLPKTIQTEKLVFHSEIEIFNFIKPYTSYPSSLRKNDRISAIKDRSKFCSDLERLYGIVLWQKIPRIQTIKELVSIIWNITQSRKQP